MPLYSITCDLCSVPMDFLTLPRDLLPYIPNEWAADSTAKRIARMQEEGIIMKVLPCRNQKKNHALGKRGLFSLLEWVGCTDGGVDCKQGDHERGAVRGSPVSCVLLWLPHTLLTLTTC